LWRHVFHQLEILHLTTKHILLSSGGTETSGRSRKAGSGTSEGEGPTGRAGKSFTCSSWCQPSGDTSWIGLYL